MTETSGISSLNDSQADSEEENSDDNLKIVIESPRRRTQPVLNEQEKEMIKTVEDTIEKDLDEKAAKSNLNAVNVKNILKHVVTNEHVLALVKQTENPDECDESLTVYEPKLTRAKAKELSSVPIPAVPWVKPKQPTSEVQVLFSENLQEDSSGDEYVPDEEESEDDPDSSVVSDYDPPSISSGPPTTPTKNTDSFTQTNWTEDGVFKIPPTLSHEEEQANIALRTRSKLSLSSTPLEVIEEAFIPPDITTDMYDMDCDDDDWKDFLKKFTRPLDEITKAAEDEDHDPEYNILADEEIDKVDREELRMDKAVKVTRKELNNLVAELFEFADHYESTYSENKEKYDSWMVKSDLNEDNANHAIVPAENQVEVMILDSQVPLLEQQMRQHVQLLTQNVLLTYEHPELHHYSIQTKEYLLNLKFLYSGKKQSMFWTVNIEEALRLVEYWENLFATNDITVQNTKSHVDKVIVESIRARTIGADYVPTFPTLILDTISKSNVFLYPSLLPRIPFKPIKLFQDKLHKLLFCEDQLIALGLEQFIPFAKEDKRNLTNAGDVKLKVLAELIREHMMPHLTANKISAHIILCKAAQTDDENPIKYFYKHKCAPPLIHYIVPLHNLQILPPCRRPASELPYQWKEYIYPSIVQTSAPFVLNVIPILTVSQPQPHTFAIQTQPWILPHTVITSTPKKRRLKKICRQVFAKVRRQAKNSEKFAVLTPIQKLARCLKKTINFKKLLEFIYVKFGDLPEGIEAEEMLPSMPWLGTPMKQGQAQSNLTNPEDKPTPDTEDLASVTLLKNDLDLSETLTEVEASDLSTTQAHESTSDLCTSQNLNKEESLLTSVNGENGKDNPDDINALMIASSTVKPAARKEVSSGGDKKRAKLRKEFLANLLISAPEDPAIEKEKDETFALSFYDKMREVMELDDYHKIMQILNDYEENDGVDLYRQIEPILKPKYPDLAEEFLLFLKEKEAAAVGQLVPWIAVQTRSKFLRKLETYFKDQPAQLRKIYKCLTELSQTSVITMDKIKSSLVPMLKGNAILTDLFLQNFLHEHPPNSLLEGPYETIDIHKEIARPDNEELIETIAVPDMEDKYGGANCSCSCHKIEDPEFKSRYRHCIPCGTRFMQGKVYIQSGRGLRPATVSFITNPDVDHNIRLNGKPSTTVTQRKKRADGSPSKVTASPTKEHADEETDEDGDGKRKKNRKTPRKRKKQPDKPKTTKTGGRRTQNCDKSKTDKEVKSPRAKRRKVLPKKPKCKVKTEKDVDEKKFEETVASEPCSSGVLEKRLDEELVETDMEWESCGAMKCSSPGPTTAESESEFCEESSQDNCESDSNSSVSSATHSQSDGNASEEQSWKREEDKIILQTFQSENDKENAFRIISEQLKNRTVSQIRNRFQTLMTLLLEQVGGS